MDSLQEQIFTLHACFKTYPNTKKHTYLTIPNLTLFLQIKPIREVLIIKYRIRYFKNQNIFQYFLERKESFQKHKKKGIYYIISLKNLKNVYVKGDFFPLKIVSSMVR